jgi:hypothetical protein
LPFPVWPSLNGLMTAITSFMSFPLRPGLRCADAGSIDKASPREVEAPPRAMPRSKESNGVPSRRAKRAAMGEFQGKTPQTQLIETNRISAAQIFIEMTRLAGGLWKRRWLSHGVATNFEFSGPVPVLW